jgi:hypothetical protein
MVEKLTFSSMTWDILEDKYGILAQDGALFEDCAPLEPTQALAETLRRNRTLRLVNERARAHRLVDPVLAEIEFLYKGKITTVPEPYLEVKDCEGLSGNPDFVLSAGATKMLPLVAVVEAKKDDLDTGFPQCAAELYAAYLLDKGVPKQLYGCVTSGTDWRFMLLDGEKKQILRDPPTYFINELPRLLGIFRYILDVSLAALEQARAAASPLDAPASLGVDPRERAP